MNDSHVACMPFGKCPSNWKVPLILFVVAVIATRGVNANTLLWSDEFSGTNVDTTKWTIYNEVNSDDSACWYAPKNVVVSGGTLKIYSYEESYNGKAWTGGYLDTAPSSSEHPRYKYLEARVRITPADSFIWPTWWTVGWNSTNGTLIWPPEFDICEYQGAGGPPDKSPGQTYHYTSTQYSGWSTGVDETQWHTYGVYWTTNSLPNFYLDGVKVFTPTGPGVTNVDMKLKLTSSPNSNTRTNGCTLGIMEVDYVRVYAGPPSVAPPAAPTGLTATAVASNQINLSWAASSGATSYDVLGATVDSGPYSAIATGLTTTIFSNTGLSATTTYYYVVAAWNNGGESPYSAQTNATPLAAPAPPTGLTATALSTSQIALSWNASSGATSYSVKRAPNSGGSYTNLANPSTTNYTDSALATTTTYYYVVSALNGGGESTNSTEANATTLSAFQSWQMQYFGSLTNLLGAPDADPYGKGISNFNQFLLGLNPTNPASMFQILSVAPQSNDVLVTWKTGGGCTNVVQATGGDVSGNYVTNFTDISGPIAISGSGDTTTNYLDGGGATNTPSRFYRIRLGP
jgi:hypothetical protein